MVPTLLELTSKITVAYVGNNTISMNDLPGVVSSIYRSLAGLGSTPEVPPVEERRPPVPIRKSVTPEYIVCLEDGKKLKMLKRHLKTVYDMTPEDYRAKWGLPPEYPMVAPNYAQARSAMAKSLGLGRKRRSA